MMEVVVVGEEELIFMCLIMIFYFMGLINRLNTKYFSGFDSPG